MTSAFVWHGQVLLPVFCCATKPRASEYACPCHPGTGDASLGTTNFLRADPRGKRLAGDVALDETVTHVIIPQCQFIADVAAVELGTIPAIEGAHGRAPTPLEVGGAAAFNEVDD